VDWTPTDKKEVLEHEEKRNMAATNSVQNGGGFVALQDTDAAEGNVEYTFSHHCDSLSASQKTSSLSITNSFISNLSYDRSTASSKTIPPLNAI
jgi:Fe-S cluster biogenesis protein NfuA